MCCHFPSVASIFRISLTLSHCWFSNGLAPNRWQNMIWTNDDPAHWRHMRSFGHSVLMTAIISAWMTVTLRRLKPFLKGESSSLSWLLHDGDVVNFEYIFWGRGFVASVNSSPLSASCIRRWTVSALLGGGGGGIIEFCDQLTPTAPFRSLYSVRWCIRRPPRFFSYLQELGFCNSSNFCEIVPKQKVTSDLHRRLNPNRKWHVIYTETEPKQKVACDLPTYKPGPKQKVVWY